MDKGSLVVITGMTGAGRSTAAKELEDLGYFVVDNLPPGVIEEVVRLVDQRDGIKQPIAVVSDIRSGTFFERLRELLAKGLPTRQVTLVFWKPPTMSWYAAKRPPAAHIHSKVAGDCLMGCLVSVR